MSSPRRASNGADSSEENEIQRKGSNIAKLRRLASNEDYKSTFSLNEEASGIPMETPPESPATVLNDMIRDASKRKSTRLHADIRNFVEKEYHKSTAARELIRHLIFVVILIAGVTLHRSAFESYLMNQALITSFITQETDFDLQPFPKSFLDVGQPDELRDWLVSVLGGTLDSDEFYSGKPKTEDEMDYVMFANRLLGGVRIRQLRAAPKIDCKVPNQLRDITNTCYAYSYGPSNRDRAPFGPPENKTKYTYSSQEETGSVTIIGYILDFLDGGGYTVDMNLERRDEGVTFTEQLEELINDTWIDPATRAVIISMVFLNTELESRVSVLYLIIEIPGNGAIFPSYMLKTFRLNLYVVTLDYFRLVLEILFVLFVLYAIYAEVWEMVKNHRMGGKGLKKYFYNGWNLIELVDIVLYICVITLYVKYLVAPERYKAKLDSRIYHSDMERLAATALIFYNICAINVIITTFRTFKYLKLNHRLYLLWKALRHAGADLIGFLFIFLIFIFGFIFMGWLSFGADMEEFNTFVHAFSTCWTFIIGNAPDYDAMFRSNRLLGPLFFVLFTIFIFFILANMFIAIISNSFEVVNEDVEDDAKFKDLVEEKVSELVNTVKKLYYQVTNKEDNKQRGIMQLLDHLVDPEALEKPNVTPEDVARAIGPTATRAEVEDLYKWTKKLEAKNATKRVKENRSSKAGLMSTFGIEADGEEDEEAADSVGSPKSLTRKQVADLISASPVMVDNDTKAAIKELQNQMKELKEMLTHRRNINNNNADS